MNQAEIERRVAELQKLESVDREAAVTGASVLRDETLAAIADGAPDGAALARAAMVTIDQDIGGA